MESTAQGSDTDTAATLPIGIPASVPNNVPLFAKLPVELIERVLVHLDLSDILSLRATNHPLHDFIHELELEICRIFFAKLRRSWNIGPSLQLPEEPFDLTALLDLYRNQNAIFLLAQTVAEHVSRYGKRLHPRFASRLEKEDWQGLCRNRLVRRLFPGLIILQSFLCEASAIFRQGEIDLRHIDLETYLEVKDVFELDQCAAIQKFNCSDHDLREVTYCFQTLVGVLQAHKLPMQHQNHDDPKASVKMLMIFQGLFDFRRILEGENESDREAALRQAALNVRLYRHSRGVAVPRPVPNIKSIGYVEDERRWDSFLFRDHAARNQFWQNQDLWEQAALSELAVREVKKVPLLKIRDWLAAVMSEDAKQPDLVISASWNTTIPARPM